MRLIHLSTFWTVIIDILAWAAIHMGVALAIVRIPAKRFNPSNWLFRSRPWERSGNVYQDAFRVRAWKDYLPDGSPLLGKRGFPKKKLGSRDPAYFEAFLLETCRAEAAHWTIALFSPFFFLWNLPVVGFIMILYGAAENLPLIIAQRYNRCRLKNLLARKRFGRHGQYVETDRDG